MTLMGVVREDGHLRNTDICFKYDITFYLRLNNLFLL